MSYWYKHLDFFLNEFYLVTSLPYKRSVWLAGVSSQQVTFSEQLWVTTITHLEGIHVFVQKVFSNMNLDTHLLPGSNLFWINTKQF